MEKNTQLPVEVVEQIENDSIERFPVTLTHGNHVRPILMQRAAYVTGATAYATKWFTCFEESNKMAGDFADSALKMQELQQENAELRRWNEKMKAMAAGWRPLLEEVLKNDAAFGKLPIKLIDKIKKYLYGE